MNRKTRREGVAPPAWADRLLEWCCAPHLLEEVQGDLHERFYRRVAAFGARQARRQYAREVLGFLRPVFFKRKPRAYSPPHLADMLKNYFTVALRNLQRHKGYSFINILGLSIGLACCITIFLFVRDELRYDTFHAKADRIYRIQNDYHSDGKQQRLASSPPAFGPSLQRVFPEVEQSVRLFDLRQQLVSYGDKKFFEKDFLLADSTVFDVFTLPFALGNPREALNDPRSLVISESVARKYFGNGNPLNRELTLSGSVKLRITGVMKDLPAHSHLKINALGSLGSLTLWGEEPSRLEDWGWQMTYTYLLLPEGYDAGRLEAKLPAFLEQYAEPKLEGGRYEARLQPLKKIHLHSAGLEFDIAQTGDIHYVYAFSAIALFALLIACFNFMNLSTARSARRAKEVGLRKVIGANRSQLVGQFLGESVLLAVLALVIALVLVALALPAFNVWAGKNLSIGTVFTPLALAGLLATAVAVGLLAGSYPALFLSGFRPVRVMKGDLGLGGRGSYSFRQVLVVMQFAVSTALIIATGVVFYQLRYMQQKNLGFAKEQLVFLPMRTGDMQRNYQAIAQELLRHPGVTAATASYGVPGGAFAGESIRLPGRPDAYTVNMFLADHNYIPTMGMQLVAGRNFSRQFATDEQEAFILNETAVRDLGWGDPVRAIGKEIFWETWGAGGEADTLKRGRVVGVVKDFHAKSFHQKIEPMVMHIYPGGFNEFVVRIRPENTAATLGFLRGQWAKLAPEWPFDYQFLDDQFARLYASEQTFGRLFGVFTGLSIFVACLGLFGLASFTAQQRTKEIGVRKILGASVGSIVALLSRDFLKLIAIAFVLAAPAAWYFMREWLQHFVYRVDLGWWIFAAAGGLAGLIALCTISLQSIRAALTAPVKSLRNE
jgi:putative ABC transport system permease protein